MPLGGPKKILVIDDSKLSRLQAKLTLEKKGFAVMELDNADDYFRALWNYTEVGLIVLDIGLPGTNGVDALRRMQENKSNAWPPVIIISGNQESRTIADTIKLGAKDYLIKPFNDEELFQRVERHIGSINAITASACPVEKQLWSFFFTANASSLGTGVAVIDGNKVAGGTSVFYFTGYCDIRSNPVSARLTVNRFAPGQSIFGPSFNTYTLVLHGTRNKDELSLNGHVQERPENKVTSLMKKLMDL